MAGGVSTAFAPLFKLVMITSGCPVLDALRPAAPSRLPLVWTRLGLGDLAGNYLTAQFLEAESCGDADWELRERASGRSATTPRGGN